MDLNKAMAVLVESMIRHSNKMMAIKLGLFGDTKEVISGKLNALKEIERSEIENNIISLTGEKNERLHHANRTHNSE